MKFSKLLRVEKKECWRPGEGLTLATEKQGGNKENISSEESIRQCFFSFIKYNISPPKKISLYSVHYSPWQDLVIRSYLLSNVMYKKPWFSAFLKESVLAVFSLGCDTLSLDWFSHSAVTCCKPLAQNGNSLSYLIRYLIHNKSIVISFMFAGNEGGAALC